jgi:hypothetical protein
MKTSHVQKVLPEAVWVAITVSVTMKYANETRRLQNDVARI